MGKKFIVILPILTIFLLFPFVKVEALDQSDAYKAIVKINAFQQNTQFR